MSVDNEHITGIEKLNCGETVCQVEAEMSRKVDRAWVRRIAV